VSVPGWPELWIEDCQTSVAVDVPLLAERARRALGVLRETSPDGEPGFVTETEAVEISLVSDDEMARIHGEFLEDPTPTDVITFGHGELLVGAETAAREAAARGWPLERELLLYVVHGILHLQGFEDATDAGGTEMERVQERILAIVWPWPEAKG
jgi:probable rRNA maturation factor